MYMSLTGIIIRLVRVFICIGIAPALPSITMQTILTETNAIQNWSSDLVIARIKASLSKVAPASSRFGLAAKTLSCPVILA